MNLKKALAMAAAIGALTLCMGMSYAWFTSSVETGEIKAQAAKIKLSLNEEASQNYVVEIPGGYLPGESIDVGAGPQITFDVTRNAILELSLNDFKALNGDGTNIILSGTSRTAIIYKDIRDQILNGIVKQINEPYEDQINYVLNYNDKLYIPINPDNPLITAPTGSEATKFQLDLYFNVPADLGGNLKNYPALVGVYGSKNDHNAKEQLSSFSFELKALLVQASEDALLDVFGYQEEFIEELEDKFPDFLEF
jgi:hypothetical protein